MMKVSNCKFENKWTKKMLPDEENYTIKQSVLWSHVAKSGKFIVFSSRLNGLFKSERKVVR